MSLKRGLLSKGLTSPQRRSSTSAGGICCHIFFLDTVADTYYSESSNKAGMGQVYEQILKAGKANKTCTACNRGLNAKEMAVFEKYVCAVIRDLHECRL